MDDSSAQPFDLRAEHVDVGLTIETTIYAGDVPLLSYRPGTRHVDAARELARDVVTDALRPLFAAAADARIHGVRTSGM